MRETLTDRLQKVLEEIYDGNMEQMASAIGVSRTTCMRYVKDEIAIPKKSFVALSQAANIRLDWLERGIGGPEIQYFELSSDASVEQFGLPVYSAPIENTPSENSTNRLGMKLIATPPYYDSTRYWVKVSRPMDIAAIVVGDYILIKPIQMRSPDEDDIDRLRVVKRGDKIQLDKVTKTETQASANRTIKICGIPVLLHRDLM